MRARELLWCRPINITGPGLAEAVLKLLVGQDPVHSVSDFLPLASRDNPMTSIAREANLQLGLPSERRGKDARGLRVRSGLKEPARRKHPCRGEAAQSLCSIGGINKVTKRPRKYGPIRVSAKSEI